MGKNIIRLFYMHFLNYFIELHAIISISNPNSIDVYNKKHICDDKAFVIRLQVERTALAPTTIRHPSDLALHTHVLGYALF